MVATDEICAFLNFNLKYYYSTVKSSDFLRNKPSDTLASAKKHCPDARVAKGKIRLCCSARWNSQDNTEFDLLQVGPDNLKSITYDIGTAKAKVAKAKSKSKAKPKPTPKPATPAAPAAAEQTPKPNTPWGDDKIDPNLTYLEKVGRWEREHIKAINDDCYWVMMTLSYEAKKPMSHFLRFLGMSTKFANWVEKHCC